MKRARSSPASTLVSRTTGIDAPAFAAAFDALPAPRTTWNAPDDALVLASGAAATLTASGPDRFAEIRAGADDLFDSGDVHAGTEAAARPRLFGGFAFHDGGCDGDPWGPFPEARFVLPRVQVTFADNGTWLTVNAVGDDADPDAVEARLATERDRLAGLATTVRPPRPGSRRLAGRRAARRGAGASRPRSTGSAAATCRRSCWRRRWRPTSPRRSRGRTTLDRLAEKYPDCHRYYFEPDAGGSAFFGATPSNCWSRCAAGPSRPTRSRGRPAAGRRRPRTSGSRASCSTTRQERPRTRARRRHRPRAAGAVRGLHLRWRASGPPARHGPTPSHPDHGRVERRPPRPRPRRGAPPTPAVGGLPPDRALETIHDTEPFDRGWYAAPVGWIDAAGNGAFAVAIRSAVATPVAPRSSPASVCRRLRPRPGVGRGPTQVQTDTRRA